MHHWSSLTFQLSSAVLVTYARPCLLFALFFGEAVEQRFKGEIFQLCWEGKKKLFLSPAVTFVLRFGKKRGNDSRDLIRKIICIRQNNLVAAVHWLVVLL